MDFKRTDTPNKSVDINNLPTGKTGNSSIKILLGLLIFGGLLTVIVVATLTPTTSNLDNIVLLDIEPEQPTIEDIYLQKLQAATDIDNTTTRNFAIQLAAKFPGKYNINQVCKIYDYIFQNWKYVNDPRGKEFFSSASNTINANLTGDCDDFAIILATLVESIGGKTRINFATNDNSGHAFAEVYFQNEPSAIRHAIDNHYQDFLDQLFGASRVQRIHFRNDPDGGIWLNLDWTSQYPGGAYFDYTECTIYYPRENTYTKYNK